MRHHNWTNSLNINPERRAPRNMLPELTPEQVSDAETIRRNLAIKLESRALKQETKEVWD